MNIRYTKLVGLLSLTGLVAGLVMAGILYTIEPVLSIPGFIIAAICAYLFIKFIYHFIRMGPQYALTDEDREEFLE